MLNALQSYNPSAEIPEADRIYDWLIGSWNVEVIDYLENGEVKHVEGEWHFGRILEGRAIQDVFICPSRPLRDQNTSKVRNRYGTSIRVFHPGKKRWEVTWLNPVTGAHDRLVARKEGDKIIQEGKDDEGYQMRWIFTDIRPDSARWYGERSKDGGASWTLEAEFFLTRP